VVFKLCASALKGAVRNSKGAVRNSKGAVRNSKGVANFFRQNEIFEFFYRNLADFSIKNGLMLFIIKNKPIFYTNSKKASYSNGL
jgi:hypothetical protein